MAKAKAIHKHFDLVFRWEMFGYVVLLFHFDVVDGNGVCVSPTVPFSVSGYLYSYSYVCVFVCWYVHTHTYMHDFVIVLWKDIFTSFLYVCGNVFVRLSVCLPVWMTGFAILGSSNGPKPHTTAHREMRTMSKGTNEHSNIGWYAKFIQMGQLNVPVRACWLPAFNGVAGALLWSGLVCLPVTLVCVIGSVPRGLSIWSIHL